jgi:hypothetical protein
MGFFFKRRLQRTDAICRFADQQVMETLSPTAVLRNDGGHEKAATYCLR